MAKVKTAGRQSSAKSGLQIVGGAAAGAAAGSLVGPIGAAVGAVVGGIAGANAGEIAESKPMKRLASATKTTVGRAWKGKSRTKALIKAPSSKTVTKKTPAAANKKPTVKTAVARKVRPK